MKVNTLKIALIPNMSKPDVVFYTKKVIKIFSTFNFSIIMSNKYKLYFKNLNCEFLDDGLLYKSCDIFITIGGDGTLIHSAVYAAIYEKPILGINLGRLGFVTEIEKNDLYKLKRIAKGDYTIEKRMMLDITLKNKNSNIKKYYALNDAVIFGRGVSNLIDINMTLNKAEFCSIRADGIIISTPTGSTAYSLSAGRPIIDPCMNCILTTQICSHSLFSRPMIFSKDSLLIFSFDLSRNNNISLSIDGSNIDLDDNYTIEISSSEKSLKLISFKDNSFYKKITTKLSQRKN